MRAKQMRAKQMRVVKSLTSLRYRSLCILAASITPMTAAAVTLAITAAQTTGLKM